MIKNNNFDFLRFLFSIFVVVSHAYPLSGNDESMQWIYQITNGQTVLARLGLYGFFIISGFFIFKSLERSKSLWVYYKKRFLRLFPALFFVLLITLILAPFVYQGTIPFYKNQDVYSYLPNNLSLYNFQAVIEGIFDNNPYHSINGSLWTIRYEFSLYIGLSLLYFFRKDSRITKVLLVACLAILLLIVNFFMEKFGGSSVLGMIGYEILDLGTFFVCGSVMAALGFEKLKHSWLFLISISILILSIHFNFFNAVKHVVLPVIVLIIGYTPLPFFSTFGKIGDMSYGIYIYSFPVQQTLMYFFAFGLYEFMCWSVFISIVLGYLSWHLVEKKALKYKNVEILKFS